MTTVVVNTQSEDLSQVNGLADDAEESQVEHEKEEEEETAAAPAPKPRRTRKAKVQQDTQDAKAPSEEGPAPGRSPDDLVVRIRSIRTQRNAEIAEAEKALRARLESLRNEEREILAELGEDDDEGDGESDSDRKTAERTVPIRAGVARKARPATADAKPATPKRPAKKKSGRLARRSAEDIQREVGRVVDLLKKHPEGLRAEVIRVELQVDAKELPRVLKQGLSDKVLSAKGQKRATEYSLRTAPKAKRK